MRKIAVVALAVAAAVVVALLATGCGGGLDPNTGAAEGYLYLPTEGSTVLDGYVYMPASGSGALIVSQSPAPPAGYVPVDGAIVSLNTGSRLTDTTNGVGYFIIIGLPPGTYEITITVPGFAPLHITVKGNPIAVIISGSPTAPPGFAPGVFVILQFEGGINALTDPNGYFYGAGLGSGPIEVTITIPGFPPFRLLVWIHEGQVHTGGFGQLG
jgi:hypothetical protein